MHLAHARTRRPLRPALAALLTALLGLALLAPAPAYADGAFCPDGKGVSVAVDFGTLGGGTKQACVEDGAGQTAVQIFEEAGFELTALNEYPGVVCRIDGEPAEAGCAKMPPADAYWGLFLAGAKGWDYAPLGADLLKPKDGDFLAFAWQSSKRPTPPSMEPVAGPSTSDSAGAQDQNQGQDTSQSQDETEDAAQTLDWWIPVGVLVLLILAAAVVMIRRRRI